jgi:protocatechuate 3,4-dioxygenase alpha subunit
VKPAPRDRAPCINVTLHASGLMRPLVTQLFFPREPLNDSDPQLSLVPAGRRALLIATPAADGALRFDIALGGPQETPFFED